MFFGYARISTTQEKSALQLDALLKYGVKEKNIYADKVSGATKERESLNTVLYKLREGDTLVVWKIDRIARSVSHLTKLINDFESRKINLVSIQEPFLDTTSAYGKFIFTIFAAIAELERSIIIERTVAGLESAKRRGVKIGRKYGLLKDALNMARIEKVILETLKTICLLKTFVYYQKLNLKVLYAST